MTLETKKTKSRRSSLKRTEKRGYTRNLGRKPNGIQPKFYLGHHRDEAIVREKRLVVLWNHIEKWVGMQKTVWTPEYLEVAKAIARGETPEIRARQYEASDLYVFRINELTKEMGVEVVPYHDGVYEWGVKQLESEIELANKMLARTPGQTGQTLHESLLAFQDYIEKEYVDSDGKISDNGKTKWRQVPIVQGRRQRKN